MRRFTCEVGSNQETGVRTLAVSKKGQATIPKEIRDAVCIEPGGDVIVYESTAAFERDWVPVKRPFLPETDLPVPKYTTDSYVM